MAVFVKKYLDVGRFALWAEGTGDNKRARLIMSFRDGQPRLTVYTGVSGKDGVLSFPSDVPTMVYFLARLKEVAAGENGTRWPIDSLTHIYENDKPTKQKRVVSTVYVGKSSEGIVYISVIGENRPKIVFEIKPSEYHLFKDRDNQKLSDGVVSAIMAKGLSDFMLQMLSDAVMRHAVEDATEGGTATSTVVPPYNAPPAPPISVLEDVPY
jgi:DNA-binding protein YbaB